MVTRPGEAVVVALSGEVDYVTTPPIRETVLGVLAERPALAVIDLREVTFLGSAGLAVLAEAVRLCGSHTALRVVAAAPVTLRPVQLAGLEGHLKLCLTIDDALAAVAGPSAGVVAQLTGPTGPASALPVTGA